MPSSPHGPCSSGSTDVDPAEVGVALPRHLARVQAGTVRIRNQPGRGSIRRHLRKHTVQQGVAGPGSSGSRCQAPSRPIPTTTTFQRSRSSTSSTAAPETHEMACSELRPPTSTSTRGRRGGGATCAPADSEVIIAPTLSGTGILAPWSIIHAPGSARQPSTRIRAPWRSASGPPSGHAREPGSTSPSSCRRRSTPTARLVYGRDGNPVWSAFEQVVAGLEGGAHALAFGSGLAAINAVLSLVPIGGVVVAPLHPYSGTRARLTSWIRERSLRACVGSTSPTPEAVAAAMPGADLACARVPHQSPAGTVRPTCSDQRRPSPRRCCRGRQHVLDAPGAATAWTSVPMSCCTREPSTWRGTPMP